jgi:ribose transport system substrate-binding protein
MLATADFNAQQIAYLATECAVRHLRGEPVPEAVELPVQVVDQANCGRWDRPYEQRPLIRLEDLRKQP